MSDLKEREIEETGGDKEQTQQAQELSESELTSVAAGESESGFWISDYKIWEMRAKATGRFIGAYDSPCPRCKAEDRGRYSIFKLEDSRSTSKIYFEYKCFNDGCNFRFFEDK